MDEELRLIEMLEREHRTAWEFAYKALEITVEQTYKIVFLASAIAAFVPPLLSQSSNLPVNRWFLRRGVESFLWTIAIGTTQIFITQLLLSPHLKAITRYHERLSELLSEAFRAEDHRKAIAVALKKGREESTPSMPGWWWIRNTGIGIAVVFYSCFLYGIWCLFRAVM